MSVYVVPIFIILVLLYASYKNLNTYNIFVKGAKGAIDLVVSIFPYIVAIMISVALMRTSGLTDLLTKLVSPIFNFLGIPSEVSELVLLRPFTGSGSFALLNDIYAQYGPDSYVARCASVIMGSSETVFYVATVYFSQTKVKKLLYAIPCALVASLVAAVLSCLLCRVM
ncbi:MAG: spore maturation protein [Firmicutes bacterium]|nr:spore maturation protein [Bacillota bacterium]MDY3659240.1 spore maturation protein [Eubacteriales bacterium]